VTRTCATGHWHALAHSDVQCEFEFAVGWLVAAVGPPGSSGAARAASPTLRLPVALAASGRPLARRRAGVGDAATLAHVTVARARQVG
jgi:hypothetical protein